MKAAMRLTTKRKTPPVRPKPDGGEQWRHGISVTPDRQLAPFSLSPLDMSVTLKSYLATLDVALRT
jgi:hypothetical protein